MSRQRYTPEQIISMLREAEVALAQGKLVGQVFRTSDVHELVEIRPSAANWRQFEWVWRIGEQIRRNTAELGPRPKDKTEITYSLSIDS